MTHFDADELDRIAYAMASGTLDAEELAWVNSEGNSNPDFVAKVAYWQQHLSQLDHATPAVEPPPHVWRKIEKELNQASQPSKSTSWWLPFAMAASILLIGVLGFWQAPNSNPSVNLDNQWLVQLDTSPQQLVIQADNPISVPEGMVCNLWFKTKDTIIGIAQLPMNGSITLDLEQNPQLRSLLNQAGTMMVTMDAADAGLEIMLNQAVINGQWL